MGKMRMSSLLMHGGVCRIRRNTGYWNWAKRIAKQISVSQQRKMVSPARCVRLLKADYELSKGIVFFITIRVKGVDGTSVAYTAEVWSNVGNNPIQVLAFDKVEGSERIPEDWDGTDKKVSTKKMGKEGLDLFKGLSSAIPMTTSSELDCGNNSGGLRTRAFYILLEQIRSQRSWTYSRARKCASTMWQGLSESEKMVFVREAAQRSN